MYIVIWKIKQPIMTEWGTLIIPGMFYSFRKKCLILFHTGQSKTYNQCEVQVLEENIKKN